MNNQEVKKMLERRILTIDNELLANRSPSKEEVLENAARGDEIRNIACMFGVILDV